MSANKARRTSKFLGCLIKGPLGCLAFLGGMVVVFVIFMPPVLGKLLARDWEETFSKHHLGSLEVKEAWLGSFYGPQRIESVLLRDPDGNEVFNAEISAPSLFPLIFRGIPEWGDVRIQVPRLRLVEDANGVTNLDRALELRADSEPRSRIEVHGDRRSSGIRVRDDHVAVNLGSEAVHFEIYCDRVEWSDQTGRTAVIDNVLCTATLGTDGNRTPWSLSGKGTLEGGPPEGVHFSWVVDDVNTLDMPEVPTAWGLELDLTEPDVEFVSLLIDHKEDLRTIVGDRISSAGATLTSSRPGEVEIERFELEAAAADIRLSARWRLADDKLIARKGDSATFRFVPTGWWKERVVLELLPLVDLYEWGDEPAELIVRDFSIPMGEGLSEVIGRCSIVLGQFSYAWPSSVADKLDVSTAPEYMEGARFIVQLSNGTADFREVELGGIEHRSVEIMGNYDLRKDSYELMVIPDSGRPINVSGSRGRLTIIPAEE